MFVIRKETTYIEVEEQMQIFRKKLSVGKNVAFVICKGAIFTDVKTLYGNHNKILREDAIRYIVKMLIKIQLFRLLEKYPENFLK